VADTEVQGLVGKATLAGAVASISTVNPVWGIAASAALPALDHAIDRWQEVRARRTVEALTTAATTAGVLPDELVARLTASDQLTSLLAAALNAAANAALTSKVQALGRSLGSLATDEALVDTEALWIRIFSDIDAPHVRVLLELLKEDHERPGHLRLVRAGDMRHVISSSAMTLVVLQTLEQHGLARRVNPEELDRQTQAGYGIGPPTFERMTAVWYMAGGLARECQERLADEGRSGSAPAATS
jgi:hypothetical protein